MIITLVFFVAFVVSLIYCYLSKWRNDTYRERCLEIAQGVPLWVSLVLFTVSLAILIVAYPGSLSRYADFIAYEKAIQAEYKIAIDRTEQLMMDNPDEPTHVSIGFLALPLLSHSTQVADRVKEKRNLVAEYHYKYEAYKLYLSRWIFRQYMAKPPEGLFE